MTNLNFEIAFRCKIGHGLGNGRCFVSGIDRVFNSFPPLPVLLTTQNRDETIFESETGSCDFHVKFAPRSDFLVARRFVC